VCCKRKLHGKERVNLCTREWHNLPEKNQEGRLLTLLLMEIAGKEKVATRRRGKNRSEKKGKKLNMVVEVVFPHKNAVR